MIFLLLSVVSSSLLMVIFKISGRRNMDSFQVILINYIVATIIGYSIVGLPKRDIFQQSWLLYAFIIGILFIVIFLIMARSTQKSGIAITTVASKMSVIIPIIFSILYFTENVTWLKTLGIVLAMISVFLTVYKKDTGGNKSERRIVLPLILFIGTGLIDSLIKYTQEVHLTGSGSIMFASTLFCIAAISGIAYTPFRKKSINNIFNKDVLIAGLVLGIINFGSLYGIVMALESRVFDSSIIFGVNNIGIVMFSVFLALLIFNEKLSKLNRVGIILSLVSILILSLV